MSQERIHPGYNEQSLFSGAPFESFLPFVRYPGLMHPLGKRDFVHFLKELHELTGNLWRPDNCRTIENLEKGARLLVCQKNVLAYEVATRRFDRRHYWITLTEELGAIENPLIVDPYGMRTVDENPKHCRPFFGPLSLCDEFQQWHYSQGLPMDSHGTSFVILPWEK